MSVLAKLGAAELIARIGKILQGSPHRSCAAPQGPAGACRSITVEVSFNLCPPRPAPPGQRGCHLTPEPARVALSIRRRAEDDANLGRITGDEVAGAIVIDVTDGNHHLSAEIRDLHEGVGRTAVQA